MTLVGDRSEAGFEDYKPPLTEAQAKAEANRCLFCADAPCIKACPTHIDIPQFIRKIATDNVKGSARTIFDANILGMSCARVCPVEVLCVGDCVYNHKGEPPIAIGKLQRYATDTAFDKGWRFFEAGKDSGKSVGLLGAGPASLAAAHELRRYGHRVTIYEKRPVHGGLNSTGVAPYKMKADRSLDEVEWIRGIGGIEIKTETVDAAALRKKHDAVFLGVGLGADTKMNLPGETLEGVFGAVDWIERMKLGHVPKPKHAVVVGGGNTAMDCMRELLTMGVETTLVYRRTEAEMSGYAHEWAAAKQLGAKALWKSLPLRFEGQGSVSAVVCTGDVSVKAELVLIAIGQAKLAELVRGLDGVKVDNGRIVTDDDGATGCPGVYAGGDCRNGGKEVVNAVAEGKQAARAIHMYLGGQRA